MDFRVEILGQAPSRCERSGLIGDFSLATGCKSAESAFSPMLIGAAEGDQDLSSKVAEVRFRSDLSSRLRWGEPVDCDCNRLIRGCVSWALMAVSSGSSELP